MEAGQSPMRRIPQLVEADIRAFGRHSGFDPSPTLAVHCGNGFDARFEPYSTSSFEPIQCWPLTLGAEMRRRELIRLLGGVAVGWPLARGGPGD